MIHLVVVGGRRRRWKAETRHKYFVRHFRPWHGPHLRFRAPISCAAVEMVEIQHLATHRLDPGTQVYMKHLTTALLGLEEKSVNFSPTFNAIHVQVQLFHFIQQHLILYTPISLHSRCSQSSLTLRHPSLYNPMSHSDYDSNSHPKSPSSLPPASTNRACPTSTGRQNRSCQRSHCR